MTSWQSQCQLVDIVVVQRRGGGGSGVLRMRRRRDVPLQSAVPLPLHPTLCTQPTGGILACGARFKLIYIQPEDCFVMKLPMYNVLDL